MTLGQAIKLVRVAKGIKQEELAEKCGISVGYVSMLERGKRDCSWSRIPKICEHLRISTVLFLFLLDQDHPSLVHLAPMLSRELLLNLQEG